MQIITLIPYLRIHIVFLPVNQEQIMKYLPPGKLLIYTLKSFTEPGLDKNTFSQVIVNNAPGLMKSTSFFHNFGIFSLTYV
jgi:hypothetical protein